MHANPVLVLCHQKLRPILKLHQLGSFEGNLVGDVRYKLYHSVLMHPLVSKLHLQRHSHHLQSQLSQSIGDATMPDCECVRNF